MASIRFYSLTYITISSSWNKSNQDQFSLRVSHLYNVNYTVCSKVRIKQQKKKRRTLMALVEVCGGQLEELSFQTNHRCTIK